MIAIDWGTSNFRSFLLDGNEKIIERRSFPGGVLFVQDRSFGEILLSQVGDWLAAGESRILLCGMIGSRQGWVETQYVSCPARVEDIAGAVIRVPFDGAEVFLVPGVIGTDHCGVPEVMRGEETEAMGILDTCEGGGLVCLPGTHSKWIQLHERTIVSFSTFMTGEVFAVLRKYTILGRIMTSSIVIDNEAFLRGVARSADHGDLLHHIFGVRTLGLLDQLKEEDSASYLSGLLIGHEVRAAMVPGARISLVGAVQLCSLYAWAIEACGGSFTLADEDAAARGLAAIGRRIAWS